MQVNDMLIHDDGYLKSWMDYASEELDDFPLLLRNLIPPQHILKQIHRLGPVASQRCAA